MKVKGLTIIELLAVIAVIAVVATLAVTRVHGFVQKAKLTAAERDIQTFREAIVDPEHGLLRDVGGFPEFRNYELRLEDLLINTNKFERWDPGRERGWRGPYVRSELTDPWGTRYILQIPTDTANGGLFVNSNECFRYARIVSAGPNRRFETADDRYTNLTRNVRTAYDDLVIYLTDPGVREED